MSSEITDLERDEIDKWVRQIMLSDSFNWTRLQGLQDWLAKQNVQVRVLFHTKRVERDRQAQRVVRKLKSIGRTAERIREVRNAAQLRVKTLEAKLLLKQNPILLRRVLVWAKLSKTSLTSVKDIQERKLRESLNATNVSLEFITKLVESN